MRLDYRRLIRTKDVELYIVRKERFSPEELAFILLVDLKRPSKLSDNPMLIGIETEEEFESSLNHIAGLVLSKSELTLENFEDISYFVECMLEIKPDCSYFLHDVEEDYNFKFNSNLSIITFIEPYVKKLIQI